MVNNRKEELSLFLTENPFGKRFFLVNGKMTGISNRLSLITELDREEDRVIFFCGNGTPKSNRVSIAEKMRFFKPSLMICTGGSSHAIKIAITDAVNEILSENPEAKIYIIGPPYSDGLFLKLNIEGSLYIVNSIDEALKTEKGSVFTRAGAQDQENPEEKEEKEIEEPAPLHFFIDYENTSAEGISGTEYLTKTDDVTLFYSAARGKIPKSTMDDLINKTGHFEAIRLITQGPNALDFYIAVRVGQITIEKPETQIVIITKDNGFWAIEEFCKHYTRLNSNIIIANTLQDGILTADGNTKRKNRILDTECSMEITDAYALYRKEDLFKKELYEKIKEIQAEDSFDSAYTIATSGATYKTMYHACLRKFGQKNGKEIYRIIKDLILEEEAL